MSVEKIIERIMEEVQSYEKRMMEETRREVEKIMENYRLQAEKIGREILDSGKKKADGILSQAEFKASIVRKNQVLQMKTNLIDEVFAGAEERVEMMPEEAFLELLWNILNSAAETGTGEILFNKRDKEKFGKKFVAAANKKMKDLRKLPDFVLSEECADIRMGFILKYDNVEINCSIENIIGTKRAELEPQIAYILFGGKDSAPAKAKKR